MLQSLVAGCDAHPADIDDLAAWLHDDPARLLRRQSGREHYSARAHRDVRVPPDDLDGAVVKRVTLHPARQVALGAPAAVEHGARAQPVGGLTFRVAGGHPIVKAGPRQHPGHERVERYAIHGSTLYLPCHWVNPARAGATDDDVWGPVRRCDIAMGRLANCPG